MYDHPKCPTCGQSLPADRVQAARDKALSAFNTSRAERLTDNERRGKQLAADRDTLKAEIAELTKERENLGAGVPGHAEHLRKLTAERDTVRALAEDYTVLGPPREDLLAQKIEVEAALQTARAGTSQVSDKARAELKSLEAALAAAKAAVDKFVRREAGEARIEELKKSEKLLASEFERLEGELYLCDMFVRIKVTLLTDRINSKFEITQFKLFSEQINGGLSECCEATVKGIPYGSGLNNAARINSGMDIVRALQRHYGIQPVVFVDNRESIVDLLPMDCQVISLIVSANDPILRVEHSEDRAHASA